MLRPPAALHRARLCTAASVTLEETIRLNAAVLMVRMSDHQKELNKSIALAPSPDRANLSVNFNRRVNGKRGLMQAYRDVILSMQ